MDSESEDNTVALARSRGADVVVHAFEGFVRQRAFALAQVRTPWTLMLDADEALDAQLRDAVMQANGEFDGYVLSRTTFYCGQPLRMWSNEPLLRLFRTDRVQIRALPAAGGTAELHERWACTGPTERLPGTLLHYSYATHAAYRKKFAEYTSIEAAGVTPSATARLKQTLLVPARFVWYAFVRGALLDGFGGIRIAWFSALYPAAVQWKARGR